MPGCFSLTWFSPGLRLGARADQITPERGRLMKKSFLITTMLFISLAANALAGGDGAVKVAFDPDVGYVILNTTASGKIVASAHLDNGLPDEEFTVSIRVRYEDQSTDIFQDIATLATNGQGKGNVQVQVDINPPAGTDTLRRVAFRVRRTPNPLYLAVAWDIPLK
jgi:hypothetical protein